MKKLTVLVCFLLVGWAWCACDACGPECARACGTRRYRACCFNYLRRKRAHDTATFWTKNAEETLPNWKPALVIRYDPDDIPSRVLNNQLRTTDDFLR